MKRTQPPPSVVNLGSQSVSFPQALAVDNIGANLYVGDGDFNQILQIGLDGAGNTTTVTPLVICSCDSPDRHFLCAQLAGWLCLRPQRRYVHYG